MKCLVIGTSGQLGRALQATVPENIELIAPQEADCDLTNSAHIDYWLSTAAPDIVINAAAYTAVDAAEQNAAAATLVNDTAVGKLAESVKRHGAKLVHVSTDFVFDGRNHRPYTPDDKPNPLSVYGQTKLAGERAAHLVAPDTLIVRTAWVYAEAGRNFVQTMLHLMRERTEIKVVADQIGTPTYVRNLAYALWGLTARQAEGIYHFTDAGVASWYDFAVAICEEAHAHGILDRSPTIIPIKSSDYPTPARRPEFSVLDKSKTLALLDTHGQHWRAALRDMLGKLTQNG